MLRDMNRKDRRATAAVDKTVVATLTAEDKKALAKRAEEVGSIRQRLLSLGVVPEVELEKHTLLAALQKARDKAVEAGNDIVVGHKLDPTEKLEIDMDVGVIRKR